MRNLIAVILIGLIFISCAEVKRVDLNKEILEFVLKDRIKLNSSVQIIQESNDTIRIFDLTLIENSYNKIVLDSIKNRIGIFSFNCPPLSHPYFKDSISFITNQFESLRSSIWDTTSLGININIDSPQKELGDSIKNKTELWIERNIKEKAFLQISEPVFNMNGEVLVSSKISLEDYVIDKTYVLNKVNDKWEAIDQSTLVGKYSESKTEEIIKPDGTKVYATTRYTIVLGYYDL